MPNYAGVHPISKLTQVDGVELSNEAVCDCVVAEWRPRRAVWREIGQYFRATFQRGPKPPLE